MIVHISCIFIPVSYTHLDVYKRQILGGSCAAPEDDCSAKSSTEKEVILDPRQKILHDLNEQNKLENLGLNISIGLNGISIKL